MKKLFPLMAVTVLAAACSAQGYKSCEKYDRYGNKYYDECPMKADRPGDHGAYGGDPLSERSLGSVRGAHNEPLMNRESDQRRADGYYYVPSYDPYYRGGYWRR